jgi:polyhydroxyalkanoate synthase subunit PhaC
MADDQNKSSGNTSSDAGELARVLAEIALRSNHIVNEHLAGQAKKLAEEDPDEVGVGTAFTELATKMAADPFKLAEAGLKMWHDYFELWQSGMRRLAGEEAPPVAEPAKADARFRSELWHDWVFDYIKQSYLIAAQNIQKTVADVEGLDPQTARKVKFFTRQYVDALAPTNFVLTNPDVLKATVETGGKNLLDGLNNLLKDLERGHGQLAITMTDYKAFKLGENVTTTPGKVVYQNDLMQLIQYAPSTPDVYKTPLLIVPPWINKYYILDLRQKNSFIKWAVDQGITVFVISWVNPEKRLAHKTFDDYMLEGPLAALDAIEKATGEKQTNMIGYCLGGTLTACTLSYLKAKGMTERVKSVTFFTALIDFSEPGELGVFVDEGVVANLERKMEERGYLEGAEMATTFNMLRANDLIWSFVVNNYLLGKEPFPFDLLYWNSDSTRMPARMHTFYLRNMYIGNKLREPGGIQLAGVPIDVTQVETPAYFISTVEDHIAPWKTTYLGAQLLKGPVRFVLGGSGHIAGIVNPPVANKYWYWINDKLRDTADEWLATARKHEGSWWKDWGEWIAQFGGDRVPARKPGEGGLKVIEDAPGSYAKLRLDAEPAPKQATAEQSAAKPKRARRKKRPTV